MVVVVMRASVEDRATVAAAVLRKQRPPERGEAAEGLDLPRTQWAVAETSNPPASDGLRAAVLVTRGRGVAVAVRSSGSRSSLRMPQAARG